MEIEKQGSKGGNYVGGLLHLFDWNAKSRKKLFSSKSDLPERHKQKKRFDGNFPMTRLQMLDEDEIGAGSSMKECSDCSYASSLTDDDFYISKAPGVVARLMGLDSMPISNILEPNSTPLSDCQSFTSSHYKSKNLEYSQDFTEPKYQKVVERPIKKFQTDVLPPKSAKTVPSTSHKLLSPIKSSNFISPKDAASIMEAAARIIEPGPQVVEKTNMPLASSSSVPIKVRELKEKVRAVKKPSKSESSAVKNLKGHSMSKSWNGSVDSENKRKSISLALQAKANVQKRSLVGQKEMNESSTNRVFTSQMVAQKSTLKKPSTQKGTNVLRQNNQKQNCTVDRKKSLPLKSDSQGGKKALNGALSSTRQRNSSKFVGPSKVSSSKLMSEVKDDKRQLSERVTRKKRSFDGNYHSENNQDAHNLLMKGKNGKVIDSSAVTDVVSFTFTSPMTRQGPSSVGSADSPSKRMMLNSDGMGAPKFSSLGHNVKGGDIFSTFLEKKLKELTHKIEFSEQKTKSGNFADNREGQPDSSYLLDGQTVSNLYSLRDPIKGFITGQKCQGPLGETGMLGNMSAERTLLDCWFPSPVSVLEHFSIAESCNSSDTADSNSTGGGKHWSSIRYSVNTFVPFEGDADLSDSASSTSTVVAKRRDTTLTSLYRKKPTCWELDYVKKLLINIEPMFKDYALGKPSEIINPHLFDQIENRKGHSNACENISRINRRLIFDCVNECLELRCRHYVKGGYRLWAKGLRTVKRKDRLAEDVYKVISGWGAMGHFMVDEIVDDDMSSRNGRWLDYDIEAFELGMKIESRVLNSLIDEVVDDILVL